MRPLARLRTRCWQQAYAGLVPADYLATVTFEDNLPRWQKRIERLATSRTVLRGAELDDAVAGFIITGPARDDPAPAEEELQALYVDPERQGRGVGRVLTTEVLETGRPTCGCST